MKNYCVFDVYSDFDTDMLWLRLQLLIFCSLHATEGGLKTAAHYANTSNALSKRGEICSSQGLLVAVPENAAGSGDTGSISRFKDKESKLHSWSNFKCLPVLKCEQLWARWNNYCSMVAQPVSYEVQLFLFLLGKKRRWSNSQDLLDSCTMLESKSVITSACESFPRNMNASRQILMS